MSIMIPLVPLLPRLVVSVALAAVGKVKGEAVGREKLMMHPVLPQLVVPVLNPLFFTLRKRKSWLRLVLKTSVSGEQSTAVPVLPLTTSGKKPGSGEAFIVPLALNPTRNSVGVAALVRFHRNTCVPYLSS